MDAAYVIFGNSIDNIKDHWERIKDSLPGKVGDSGRSGCDNRGFIRAVMCVARTGAPWRALLKEYGNWAKQYTRDS